MGCYHGTRHARGTTFTKEALLQLTPSVIKNWMAFKTCGKEEHDPAIDNPMGARALHLHQAKKAISHFMPNNAPQWMDGKGGNRTKSRAMNKLTGDVLKAEARRKGRPSQAKRKLTQKEFQKQMELLRQQSDWNHQCKCPCMSLWQHHLIGRSDDTAHFQVTDPRGHHRHDFCLQTKVRWSKNVLEERQCPDRMSFCAMDDNYCMLIKMSIYLESCLEQFPNAKHLFTENTDDEIDETGAPKAPKNLKAVCRRKCASTSPRNRFILYIIYVL